MKNKYSLRDRQINTSKQEFSLCKVSFVCITGGFRFSLIVNKTEKYINIFYRNKIFVSIKKFAYC